MKSKARGLSPGVALLLVSACLPRFGSPPQSDPVVTDTEREVIETVATRLNQDRQSERGEFVVLERTVPPTVIPSETKTEMESWLHGGRWQNRELQDDTIASFLEATGSSAIIDGGGLQILSTSEASWPAFSRAYPRSKGWHSFSRVGFSKDETEGLVYVQFNCGPSCGNGTYVRVQRDGGSWRVADIVGKLEF